MNLILLNFNNYFNRIVKKATLDDYLAIENKRVKQVEGFNQNDGVNTEKMVELDASFTPDYLVVVSNENTILSRWFVTECVRSSVKAYKLTLRRDVITDFYNQVVNGTCFVEKGYVSPTNPLIFNKEEFNCNQIKKAEILLRDETYHSWIVLYYDTKATSKANLKGSVNTIEEPYVDLETSLEDWDIYSRYHENGYKKPYAKFVKTFVNCDGVKTQNLMDKNGNVILQSQEQSSTTGLKSDLFFTNGLARIKNNIEENKTSIAYAMSSSGEEQDTFLSFINWNNKIIKDNNNNYYRCKISKMSAGQQETSLSSGTLFNAMKSCFYTSGQFKENFFGTFDNAFVFVNDYELYSFVTEPITNGITQYDFDFSSCQDVQDQPFGILALPFKSFDEYARPTKIGISDTLNDKIAMLIVKELTKEGVGSDKMIYDVQLLPFCPLEIPSYKGVTSIDLYPDVELASNQFSWVNVHNTSTRGTFAIHPTSAKFTKNLDIRTYVTRDLHYSYEQRNAKIDNQCTFMRLCSPNYNGQFEFNPARNLGVHYINIDCTYKPFSPYIHLNPDFKGLYGQDFDDARGLICSGDFSISCVSDAFEQYKMQNKNFEKSFDRQIQNVDVVHDLDKLANIFGIASGAAKGLVGGSLAGGDIAPLAGTGFGAITGIGSLHIAEQKFQEQKSYAIDTHNFNLQNIKALANCLNKVDAFDNNNKIFPFIEIYSCTDEEKKIFEKKIEFEGMTVNAIGKLDDFIKKGGYNTFVKGQMIRLLDINEDAHLLNVIYEEISKGVYFYE